MLAGLGIAQMAQHHTWDALTDGRLTLVLVQQHRSGGLEMSLFYPHRQGLAPRVRALVDYLLEHLAIAGGRRGNGRDRSTRAIGPPLGKAGCRRRLIHPTQRSHHENL